MRSVSGFNLWVQFLFLRFHYSERRDLNSPRKSHPPPADFEEICFFLW